MITKEQLDMIGEAALKYGITKWDCKDVCLEFSGKEPRIIMTTSELPNQPIGATHGMPTEDELLFASSIPLTEDEIAAKAP